MKCKICNSKTEQLFQAVILKKYNIKYYNCEHCGFLQTEEPFWLEEAYIESITISDTGYMGRNLHLSRKLTILLILFFNKNSKYLDYAGGYGVFVRMMRDLGFDFYWDDKFTTNLFAKGFEYQDEKIEAITSFESFEHFDNPIIEIEKLVKISKNIIFSTVILPNPIPYPENWWYYGLEHGQHISFYNKKTFAYIAKKFNLNYINLGGSLHLLSEKKLFYNVKYLLKLTKFGFHKVLQKQLKSKIWEDHLKMKKL